MGRRVSALNRSFADEETETERLGDFSSVITGSLAPKSELLTALLYPASRCRPLDQGAGVVSSLWVPGSSETLRGHLPGVLPLHLPSLCHSVTGTRRPMCSAFLLNKRSTEYFPLGRDLPLPPGLIGPDYQHVRKPRLFFMGDGGGEEARGPWRVQGAQGKLDALFFARQLFPGSPPAVVRVSR